MKANKLLVALSALALVGGLVACGGGEKPAEPTTSEAPANTLSFDLKSSFYSNDAKADIECYLKLNADLTAVLSFKNTFNGSGAVTTISDGTWKNDGSKPTEVTLGGNEQGVFDGYVKCYLGLNASGLLIADADSALIKVDFYYDETKKPAAEPEVEKATVTVGTYDHVTKVEIYDYSFTAGPSLAADNKVTVGNFIAVKLELETGWAVSAVKLGEKDTTLQGGMYCAKADSAIEYALTITVEAAA